jgi:hypothetical protein
MTGSDVTAVLTLTRSMAAERGWVQVGDFLAGLPVEGDDSVAVFEGEGVDATSLADWIAAVVGGAQVSARPLEPLRDDPAVALAANRVVMAFECGRLLKAEEVDAATQILSRPPESYAIVYVGAEAIRDLDELNLIERGIWQTLVGEPGVRWGGQDLAERRCLLWSQAEAADAIAGRIARDGRLLQEWLRSPLTASEELASLRADHALHLAEQEIAARGSDVRAGNPAAGAARLQAVRLSLETLHRRLLQRLDDDAVSVERQVTSSLELLEQDLLRDVRIRLERKGNRLSRDDDVRQDVLAAIRDGIDGWRAKTAATIMRRARQSHDESTELLDDVDWDLVNAVSAAHGDASYPDVIIERIRTPAEVTLTIGELAGPDLPTSSTPGGRGPALRIVGCGAGLAIVAAVFTPLGIGPVVSVGAMGAVGGGLANRYVVGASERRAATDYAQAAVSRVISSMLTTVREQLREATTAVRRTVAADFRAIEDALHTAALKEAATAAGPRSPADSGRAEGSSDEAQLAALKRQLAQARTGPAAGGEQ